MNGTDIDVQAKKHLFFDMDRTIAPAREPMFANMHRLLSSLPHDLVVVSGQEVPKIAWQSNNLPSFTLGQNGNHATDVENTELWNEKLSKQHQKEILEHIKKLTKLLDHPLNEAYAPIENRGAQITFSPVGNTAPVELKKIYDPDGRKRNWLIEQVPFESKELVVKIGGSTSLDYIHKDRHKGVNVERLIQFQNWEKTDCVYFGDGLYPGGNDEAVIGVIDTIKVRDHEHTYTLLKTFLNKNTHL